jgi:hypothetical protein
VIFRWPRLHNGGQEEVALHPARFKVLAAGRRWGKSKLGALMAIRSGMKGGYAWWISPTYKMALMGWRELIRFAKLIPGADVNQSERTIFFPPCRSGAQPGYVQVRSASDPDSLRGEGLNFAYLDEFAFQQREVWTHSIRPALADRRGKALFGSTPFGQNHFWDLFQQGLRWGDPGVEIKSWHFPSAKNPYLDEAEIEAARREMPEDAFRQEHLAEFLEDGAGVFRGISGILDPRLHFKESGTGRFHIIGWDPAKFADFNVTTVLDVNAGEIVNVTRSNRRPLMEQLRDVIALQKKFPGVVFLDATRDDTLLELAQANGLWVEAIRFTVELKRRMVNALSLAIEKKKFRMPLLGSEVAVGELKSFRYEIGKSGHVTYAAPPGMHDDHVTALGLCALGMGSRLMYDGEGRPTETDLPRPESLSDGWGSL